MQFYAWGGYADESRAMGLVVDPGAFGIDVFVGEPELLDRGIGSRVPSAVLVRDGVRPVRS